MLMFLLSLFVLPSLAEVPDSRWQPVLERVSRGVVVLRVDSTRGFDTANAASAVATGFVVDKERGLILTNRHVIGPGPIVARAVFLNPDEEVPVTAVYRDPVHDFGIFRYDPEALKFADPVEIPLRPERASVGREIQVVGNDAGEKLAFLKGTLALLDRNAPRYGGGFNDFNTFYYQAASGTSGGSSGSPVVDASGAAVALNAGARRNAAASFFLPLDRVVRALEAVKAKEPITRGTIQTTFQYETFDFVRRLGLSEDQEQATRKALPKTTGMLVVHSIVPGGPAHSLLEPGDVLLKVNGKRVVDFVSLEQTLDTSIDGTVALMVERGGNPIEVEIPVMDLFEITPSRYLEFGDCVINELSYQVARNHTIPAGGPYVASSGFVLENAGIQRGAVITEVGGELVSTVDDVERLLAQIPHGGETTLRYYSVTEPDREGVASIVMDRKWFPMQLCALQPDGGTWACDASEPAPEGSTWEPRTTSFPDEEDRVARILQPSLVTVDFDIPYRVEGVYGTSYRGAGLVVDAEAGLVVTDRDTVPVSLGDARISVAGSIEIPAKIVYLHPEHNIAILQYDPALMGDTPVRAAVLRPGARLEPGDRVWQVGLRGDELVSTRTNVTRISALSLPLPSPPFFRDKGVDAIAIDDPSGSNGGVLSDRKGRVVALWQSFVALDGKEPRPFFQGVSVDLLLDVLEPLQRGEQPLWRSLGADLTSTTIAFARRLGLGDEQAAELEAAAEYGRQVLLVIRRTAGTDAADKLRDGDLVLRIDGVPVTTYRAVERASQRPTVTLTVLRNGEARDVDIKTTALESEFLDRVLIWAGTVLHEPHYALPSQHGLMPQGLYVAWYWYGSPAGRYNLRPTRRLMEVDGVATPTLDAFLAAANKPDGGVVRLRSQSLKNRSQVTALVLDQQFWPTVELVRQDGEWQRIDHRP